MRFVKMQGAGNDFIILDNFPGEFSPDSLPKLAQALCARRVSLGGDALMVAGRPRCGGDLHMGFYNADGSEAEMCGNGARCIARYAYETGLAGPEIHIETTAGPVTARRIDRTRYQVRLNDPAVVKPLQVCLTEGLSTDCVYIELGSPGIPHCIVPLPPGPLPNRERLRPLGRALRSYPGFSKGANVSFCALRADGATALLTYERGVEDFTLACGTGAGASAVALRHLGLLRESHITFQVPGGVLEVDVAGGCEPLSSLHLTGPAVWVAQGEVSDEVLPPAEGDGISAPPGL